MGFHGNKQGALLLKESRIRMEKGGGGGWRHDNVRLWLQPLLAFLNQQLRIYKQLVVLLKRVIALHPFFPLEYQLGFFIWIPSSFCLQIPAECLPLAPSALKEITCEEAGRGAWLAATKQRRSTVLGDTRSFLRLCVREKLSVCGQAGRMMDAHSRICRRARRGHS